jgi:hypothetical protein
MMPQASPVVTEDGDAGTVSASISAERLTARATVPDWIGEARRAPLVQKALETARSVGAFTASPRRFSADWASGRSAPTNPLLLMIASVSAVTPLIQLSNQITGTAASTTLVGTFIANLAPFAYYAALGVVAHGVLVLLGARTKLRGSLGVGLFTGAGPAMLATLGIRASALVLWGPWWKRRARCAKSQWSPRGSITYAHANVGWAQAGLAGIGFVLTLLLCLFASLALAIAGANDVPLWKATMAVTVAVLACAYVMEPLGDHCDFAHLALRFHHGPHGWGFSGGVRS